MDNTINTNSGMENPEPVVIFDTASGISKEEQQVILTEIDALTMQNRMNPSKDDLKVKVKKQGVLFPVIVNMLAFLLLAGGTFMLFKKHQEDTLQFRQGTAYLGLTERQLIQEIRKESISQLNKKELEIEEIKVKLAEIDAELQNMQTAIEKKISEREAELRQQINRELEAERTRLTGEAQLSESAIADQLQIFEAQKNRWLDAELARFRQELEAERLVAEERLRKLRDEYQALLAQLQAEYVQIVEAARIREADLQAKLLDTTGKLNTLYDQNQQERNTVQQELSQLTDEWERSMLIEAQMSGFYATVNNQIREGQLQAASDTLGAMQEFLNTPAFQHLRFMQSRKEFYMASINTFMEIIKSDIRESPVLQTATVTAAESSSRNTEYETIIENLKAQNAALEQAISSSSSQDQAQGKIIADYETTINTLKTQNTSLEQTVKGRDSTISTLRTQNTSLQQTVSTRDNTINTLRTQNASLQQTVGAHEITIREFRTQNTTLQQNLSARDNALNEAKSQAASLQQTVSTRDSTISTLRTQNTTLQQTVTAREATAADLRTQNTNLQQTVSARDGTITELRTQNTTLQQTVSARDSTITELRTQNTALVQNVEQLRQTNEAVRKLLGTE